MARTSPTVTKKEIDAYQKFCDEHNIVADESEAARINGDEIGNYIAVQGGEDITPATLAVALQKLRDRLTFYTPAQAEYKKVADKNPTAANELNAWFQNQTILEKDSDIGLQNQTTLLVELRGKAVTAESIHLAIQRIQGAGQTRFSKGKGSLHFVPEKPRQNPLQHTDTDPNRKPGEFIPTEGLRKLADGSYGKTPADYQREANERAARNNPTTVESVSVLQSRAREAAQAVTGRTHSETARLQKMFAMKPGTSDIDWSATLNLRQQAQAFLRQ